MGTEFYYKKGAGNFGMEEHIRLRDVLKGIKGKFLLSYEDHPDIRKLYKGYKVEVVKTVKRSLNNRQADAKSANEILICNH